MNKPVITDNTITIPSDQEFLPDVDVYIEGTLRGYGADESTIADIAISVSELVNNAIAYGNRDSRDNPVKISIATTNNTVEISISDRGQGFDPNKIENPIADENLLKVVGRGIFIVRSLMDKVDFDSTDKGTTVTITKSFKRP
ncbi:MAG: ATP-binding protein [candidate division Zixibacteria bacterium]|nr:ATP-binding protein [candidate division Zixibacteria bacterium]